VEEGARGERLVERLAKAIPGIRVGAYTEKPEPFMGPLVREQAARSAIAAQHKLLELGARGIVPMTQVHGAFVTPGLIDVTNVRNVPDEEIFAPLLQVIRVRSFDEAIGQANNTRFGLCAALLTEDPSLYEPFFARIRAGVINLNRPTTGASSALPFGGVGLSGNHRPSAYLAADYCSYPIASMEADQLSAPAQLPPGLAIGGKG
jgi:succinylglutamic semialdehyde dehydrogenase